MLDSSIADTSFTLSPDMLTIYNGLNPTYPKERALTKLDSRLSHVRNVYKCFSLQVLNVIYRKYQLDRYMLQTGYYYFRNYVKNW